jgi:hypothetical protein
MRYTKANLTRLALGYPDCSHFVHMTLKAKRGESKKEVTFTVGRNSDVLDAVEDNIKQLIAVHGYTKTQIRTKTYELPKVQRL